MDYHVRVLDSCDVQRAFVVVRQVVPDLQLDLWEKCTVTPVLRNDWLSVIDGQGHVRGLCYSFVRPDAVRGDQLDMPIFVCLSLFDAQGVARRLFLSVRQRALQKNCARIHFWSNAGEDLLQSLQDRQASPSKAGMLYELATDGNNRH